MANENIGGNRIHLDTDIGGDIDDLCALGMVLKWPGAELAGVTTTSEEGGRRAGYARYALELGGRGDIPVAAGADISMGGYRILPGLPEEAAYWPEPVAAAPGPVEEALELLERSIEEGAIIAMIGDCRNLALLEKRSPGILREARLVIMGGYIFPPRDGFPWWGIDMDWNIQNDIESARIVLENSDPILVPLSVTVETALRRAHLERLRAAGPVARLIARQAEAFARDEDYEARYGTICAGLPDDTINFLHDPLACAVALGWEEGVEMREVMISLEIVEGWMTQRVDKAGKPTKVVTRVEGERFSDFWLKRVTG